jgi:hypothetical protein
MVETNGLPNFSDGSTPEIKSLDYGHWANEVLDKLGISFYCRAFWIDMYEIRITILKKSLQHFFLIRMLTAFSMSLKNFTSIYCHNKTNRKM